MLPTETGRGAVGTLVYDQKVIANIDDRALAHLQVVVINKLRRQESFSISLQDAGKTISVWVSPHSALAFVYAGNRRPTLNRRWIEDLAETANSAGGMFMIPEPPPYEAATSEREEPDDHMDV